MKKNLGKMLEYSCPHCGEEMNGGFGDDVICTNCNLEFTTEWDYFGEGDIGCWLTSNGTPVDIKSRKMKNTDKAKVMANNKTGTYQELVIPREGSLVWVSSDNPMPMLRLASCWNILRTMTDEQLESLEKQVDATIEEVGEDCVGVFVGPSLPF